MIDEGYRKRVQQMCTDERIKNPIQESDIVISKIECTVQGQKRVIEATEMNRAGRLFFQYHYGVRGKTLTGAELATAKQLAKKHFGPMWDDAEVVGRALIAGLKHATCVMIFIK